jgi:ribonuclease PH
VEEGVPNWRRGRGEGWLTAEYAMLPRATRTRTVRERSQLGGRTQEIQRLIGRSIRAMLDSLPGEYDSTDCDVPVADGTRTAAIMDPASQRPTSSTGLFLRDVWPNQQRRRVAGVSAGIIGSDSAGSRLRGR